MANHLWAAGAFIVANRSGPSGPPWTPGIVKAMQMPSGEHHCTLCAKTHVTVTVSRDSLHAGTHTEADHSQNSLNSLHIQPSQPQIAQTKDEWEGGCNL